MRKSSLGLCRGSAGKEQKLIVEGGEKQYLFPKEEVPITDKYIGLAEA